jgi:hypothetical protein
MIDADIRASRASADADYPCHRCAITTQQSRASIFMKEMRRDFSTKRFWIDPTFSRGFITAICPRHVDPLFSATLIPTSEGRDEINFQF